MHFICKSQKYRIAEEVDEVDIKKLNEAYERVKGRNDEVSALKEENERLRKMLEQMGQSLPNHQRTSSTHSKKDVVEKERVNVQKDDKVHHDVYKDTDKEYCKDDNDAKGQDRKMDSFDIEEDIQKLLLMSFLREEKKKRS